MKEESANRAKLGAFVLIATTCLILGLYYIGSKKNIFHSTIHVSANFNNVGGLMPGNNVRFNGINVGTVSKVYAIADTAIKVEFTIDEEVTEFISQNAIVSIGTDGLLGNKLIDIDPGMKGANPVQEGSVLKALNPLRMENTMRTLTMTSDNLKVITDNLKDVTGKINNNNSLWNLLSDTLMAENIRTAVVRFKLTGNNTATITGDLSKIVQDIKAGKGSVGALLTDTSLYHNINQTIINFQSVSDTFAIISGNFKGISEKLKINEGTLGMLINDTTFVHNLNISMENIKEGSGNLKENMEALKHSWPFKKYFRQQNKSKSKN